MQGFAAGMKDNGSRRDSKSVGRVSRIREIGNAILLVVTSVMFGGGSIFALLRFGGSVGFFAMIAAGKTWFLMNLGIAGVVLLWLNVEARSRARNVRFNNGPEEVHLSNIEEDPIPELNDAERGQVKRLIMSDMANGLLAPIIFVILGFWSLDSFQEIYGRLRPDYGGGALYRVHLSLSQPDKLSASIRNKLDTVN